MSYDIVLNLLYIRWIFQKIPSIHRVELEPLLGCVPGSCLPVCILVTVPRLVPPISQRDMTCRPPLEYSSRYLATEWAPRMDNGKP